MRMFQLPFHQGMAAALRIRPITLLSVMVVSYVTLAPLLCESAAQPVPTTFTEALVLQPEGVTVRHPATWSPPAMGNAHVLYNLPAQSLNIVDTTVLDNTPQVAVFIEHRKDHLEKRLRMRHWQYVADSLSTLGVRWSPNGVEVR